MSVQFKYGLFIIQCVIIVPLYRCQKKATLAPHLQGILDEYKERFGNEYNPTYGYEPYWEDGGWVYEEKETDSSSTSMPQVCGEECNYLYTDIGEVCGRLTDNKRLDGCWVTGWLFMHWYCDGKHVDDLSKGFQTFPTYCKFLDAQCRSEFSSRWILVHRGPCVFPQDLVFKPLLHEQEPLKRLPGYFTRLADVFNNQSLSTLDIP